MAELPALRASDADREAVATRLHTASTEGRLTVEELSDRLDAAYAARTHAELDVLLVDLPGGARVEAPGARAGAMPVSSGTADERTDWVVAIMSSATRKGRWRVRRSTAILALMGGADLDLRQAELEAPEVVITAISIMGGIDLLIPDGVRVDMSGFALMGGNDDRHGDVAPPPGAPVVRVRAFSLMGGVNVRRKRRRETVAEHLGMRSGPR